MTCPSELERSLLYASLIALSPAEAGPSRCAAHPPATAQPDPSPPSLKGRGRGWVGRAAAASTGAASEASSPSAATRPLPFPSADGEFPPPVRNPALTKAL